MTTAALVTESPARDDASEAADLRWLRVREQLLRRRYQKRLDLVFTRQLTGGHDQPAAARSSAVQWSVFDPITRQSFRIGLVEHCLLSHVDRRHSLASTINRLLGEYRHLTEDGLLSAATRLEQNGLLRASGSVAGASKSLTQTFQSTLSSLIVWQIRGLEPDRWLGKVASCFDWLFHPLAAKCWGLVIVLTACLVGLDFHRMTAQSAGLGWLGSPALGGMLLGVFLATRALHELGHAVLCKRLGVRCPDIGLLVIMGAPCVYCDVSESWRLPSRWQRAAVAAAGMYVELILASLAAWVWLATVDGPLNTLALQTMFVCSISTIAINANPLMRFDGYYILSDWLDEVNLRAKADRLLGRRVTSLLIGRSPAEHDAHAGALSSVSWRRTFFLEAFSGAGWVYRGLVSVAIASGLLMICSSWNLVWMGRVLAAAIMFSWWGLPMLQFGKSLIAESKVRGGGWRLAILAAAAVVVFASLPIPTRRFASGWLQPRVTQGVYAGSTARLVKCPSPEVERVDANQALFRFVSPSLDSQVIRRQAAADIAFEQLQLANRKQAMRIADTDVAPYETQANALKQLALSAEQRQHALVLHAPISGRLVAQAAPPTSGPMAEALPMASSWCDPEQLGRTVAEGTLLATICSDDFIAVVPLTAAQLSTVAADTPVRVRLGNSQRSVLPAKVAAIVQLDQLLPAGGSSAVDTALEPAGMLSDGPKYAAIVELPQPAHTLHQAAVGEGVEVVFLTPSESLYSMTRKWLSGNLRLLAN